MRRPLPASRDAPRRKRALVLLVPLVLSIPPTMVAATSSPSRSIACSAGSNLEATLTSRACGPVCGDGLCVYRMHSPSSCSMDCVPTVAEARTLAVEWLDDGPAAMAVTSTAPNEDVTSTIVVREPVQRIDSQLEVPTNVSNFSLCGPRTAPLMGFSLSESSRSTLEKLQVLELAYVNISDWKTLPPMRELQNLSLVGVGLTWWPLPASLPKLTHMTLDNNDLVSVVNTIETLPPTLVSLSLRSTGLTKIPAVVANATSLERLYLDGVKFQENGTLNLPSSLWTISMLGCGLRRIPDEITTMTGLEDLFLSYNPEIQISNDTREIPTTVQNLQLAACGLTTFPTVLSNRQLTTLDLSFNALRDDDRVLSAKLATLTKLESLDLAATNRTLVPSTIASLSKLSSLSLASNAIAAVDSTSLPSALEHLNIAHNTNPLAISLPTALASRLLSLNLSHCGLPSLSVATEPLRKLQTLDASGNALTSDAATTLPASLRFLNLSNNRLTTLPDALFQLKSLQQLDVRGNPIPRGSVTSLSSAQIAFLDNLKAFYVDAAVFQSVNCSAGAAPTTFSLGYSICSSSNERGVGGSSPEDDAKAAAAARARMNRNLYIIAATIGTALVVVTLASLAMRRRGNRRDAKKRRLMDADGAWPTELASDREMTDAEWRALQMWSFWDDEDVLRLRIPWDLVRDRQVIGSGQYSVLWLARVAAQPVFLKALQPTAHRHRVGDGEGSVAAVASLIREIQLLRALRHAHIVRLVGVTWMNAPTDVQVAIEDMANGDLRGYLELTQPPAPPSRWRGDGFSLRVALQIADAMVFLHRCGVAHNDLRSRNVVLDDDCNAKLTGFGRHVFVDPVRDGGDDTDDDDGNKYMAEAVANAVKATAKRDTDVPPPRVDNAFLLDAGRWMAPEVLRRHLRGRRQKRRRRRGRDAMTTATTATSAASSAADVYAFGVLLLELDCFEMPFARVDTEDDLMEGDWEDDDDEVDDGIRVAGQRHRAAPGPHDANDLRFSSMPSHHNSLLGGAPPHLTFTTTDVAGKPAAAVPDEAEEDEDEEEKEEKDGLAPPGATMSAGEEKCELALLRQLADGVASHAELSPTCPTSVADVILQCLQLRAERRPSIRAVRDALRVIANQRRRSSTATSSATAAASTATRSISGSQRSLLHAMSGGERDAGGAAGAGGVAVATQTVEEEQAFADGSSSADSDATTAFFVMQQSPARLRVSPP